MAASETGFSRLRDIGTRRRCPPHSRERPKRHGHARLARRMRAAPCRTRGRTQGHAATQATGARAHTRALAAGHWPDFANQDDLAQLGAEAFAFVNLARFAVPLRIGLALGTTPWVKENIVDNIDLSFLKKGDESQDEAKEQ